jgi:hypothetical protein
MRMPRSWAAGVAVLSMALAGFGPARARPELGDVVRVSGQSASSGPLREGLPDPDLEPGFPAQALHTAGSYHAGPAIHTLVGNIDGDPQLEILRTELANGPLSAWNHDGSVLAGWPPTMTLGAAYPALGNLSNAHPGLEVFSAHWGTTLGAWSGDGVALPGWPRSSANFVATPPALGDVDGDGIDEIFLEEEDFQLHAYKANGTVLPGWPVHAPLGSQERHTPAIADLDGNGDLEILTVTGTGNGIAHLLAYHHDGTAVGGFPVSFTAYVDTFPVVGDVDADGQVEIVVVAPVGAQSSVRVYSASGALERTMLATDGVFYGTAPALADLDGDGSPEIVVQTNSYLSAWKGNGTVLSGWPRLLGDLWMGNSAPVVGDVDGDSQPDIVVTTQTPGSGEMGQVRVYNRLGVSHPRFPKALPIGSGAVPAIADIDLDGRNEIVVSGDFWNGVSGFYDAVWSYDLGGGPHGSIQWGQFMGGPRHPGWYDTGTPPARFYALPPCRVLDTRGAQGPALVAGASRTFAFAGVCNIPATARAVALNVTVTQATAAGHLTLYPAGGTVPGASTINYRAGVARANNAILRLSASGQLAIFCGQLTGSTHAIVDVSGYFQ